MEQSEFERQADATLARIETALERCGADVDVELGAGGVLQLEFGDGSQMVINRHAVAREIWVAARSGGFHYRWVNGAWHDTRSGEELFAALARLVAAQSGQPVSLD